MRSLLARTAAVLGTSITSSVWSQPQFISLGNLVPNTESHGYGISGDGATAVGLAFDGLNGEAFRWQADQICPLGSLGGQQANLVSIATGASLDGGIVVEWSGTLRPGARTEAFHWTASGGMVPIPNTRDSINDYRVSGDGSTVVGLFRQRAMDTDGRILARWTLSGSVQPLSGLQGRAGWTTGASADGIAISGHYTDMRTSRQVGVLWRQGQPVRNVGRLPGADETYAENLSDDGTVVVGLSDSARSEGAEAFRWAQAGGIMGWGSCRGEPT